VRTPLPLLLLALALAVALLAGCGGDEEEAAPPPQPPAETGAETEPPAETVPPETAAEQDPRVVRIYLMRGEHLGVGARGAGAGPAVGRAALEALLDGPTPDEDAAGLGTEIPEGTQLLGLSIDEDGLAVVDLSREFESGGGSLSMQARVAQVVYTLTQFPTVDRVSFRLDGEAVDAIGGEGVPGSEVDRSDFEDVTPAILVESPTPQERVASPLRIQGTANTFEANFRVELEDADGQLLVDTFVTATSGSGERGTFDATFEFDGASPGTATLRVFEESADDGSRINVVEIPVEPAP
jgi:germination protein M